VHRGRRERDLAAQLRVGAAGVLHEETEDLPVDRVHGIILTFLRPDVVQT
jgi:hypothetical protein